MTKAESSGALRAPTAHACGVDEIAGPYRTTQRNADPRLGQFCQAQVGHFWRAAKQTPFLLTLLQLYSAVKSPLDEKS
jgi:hypothetical protein